MDNNWLVVGLGNPEIKYEKNRHNIGSWLIDYAYNNIENEKVKNKYSSLFKTQINNNVVYFAKTFFYINESGIAVRKIAEEHSIKTTNIIIVVDDMNLELGKIRLRPKGSDGGHNGLKSIQYELKTEEYNRIRIGIGKPEHRNKHVDFVLGDFSKKEEVVANDTVNRAFLSIIEIMNNGFTKAMERFN